MATRRDSDLEAAFVREYLADPDQNATRAALAAGYGGAKRNRHSARTAASRLLKRPHIAEQIQAAMDARAERTEITADRVLERLWAIATADPNEISQYRRCACRYCHGDKHLYHWLDVSEWEEACAKARDRKKPGPSLQMRADLGSTGTLSRIRTARDAAERASVERMSRIPEGSRAALDCSTPG
jgi:phage terminase small subunit